MVVRCISWLGHALEAEWSCGHILSVGLNQIVGQSWKGLLLAEVPCSRHHMDVSTEELSKFSELRL